MSEIKLIDESYETYHENRKRYLTSSVLRDYMLDQEVCKYRIDNPPDEDSDSFRFGRAAHTLMLEGPSTFDKQWVVGGPINPKTGIEYGTQTKAFQNELLKANGYLITQSESDKLALMHEKFDSALRDHGLLGGFPEVSVYADRSVFGHPCMCRVDKLVSERSFFDYKTCRNLEDFEYSARKYGYVDQIQFYRLLLERLYGSQVTARLIAQEKDPPHRVGVWLVERDEVRMAGIHSAISGFAESVETDTWISAFHEERVLFDQH